MQDHSAKTPAAYIAAQPPERRAVLKKVREVVRQHLPKGYKETMSYGMISYEIPLSRYPDTYNGQPACYAGLAAQKNHLALYLTGAYIDSAQRRALETAFKKAGKKLDMGKSCLRFKSLDDIDLDAVGKAIASTAPEALIKKHKALRKRT